MTLQNRTASRRSVSEDTAERALRDLDDRHFTEVMLRELRRRRTFARVADQVDGALRAARFPIGDPFRPPADPAAAARRAMIASAVHSAVLQVPHACSTEACEILIERGVVPGSTPADALRTFARDGRLIVLRGDRRWVYPRFQLDHFDPRDPVNIVAMINRMLDAGHYPEAATAWWTAPADSLPDRRSPTGLLGQDHATLRQLAAGYAAAAGL